MNINFTIRIPNWLDRILAAPVLFYRRLLCGVSFRRVPLSRGQFARVDQRDYYVLSKFKWSILDQGEKFYAIHNVWDDYAQKYRGVLMHSFLMNPPDHLVVDHENGDGLDNRRANLRVVSQMQNVWNRKKYAKSSSSKFTGVSWDKKCKKWRVRIHHKNKQIEIGLFTDEIEAAKAYDRAAIKYRGQFARLNFTP